MFLFPFFGGDQEQRCQKQNRAFVPSGWWQKDRNSVWHLTQDIYWQLVTSLPESPSRAAKGVMENYLVIPPVLQTLDISKRESWHFPVQHCLLQSWKEVRTPEQLIRDTRKWQNLHLLQAWDEMWRKACVLRVNSNRSTNTYARRPFICSTSTFSCGMAVYCKPVDLMLLEFDEWD